MKKIHVPIVGDGDLDLMKIQHLQIVDDCALKKQSEIIGWIQTIESGMTKDELCLWIWDGNLASAFAESMIGRVRGGACTPLEVRLNAVRDEVDRRLTLFAKYNCRDLREYKECASSVDVSETGEAILQRGDACRNKEKVPFLMVIMNDLCEIEIGDLNDAVEQLKRISDYGRAAGVHVLSTTSPGAKKGWPKMLADALGTSTVVVGSSGRRVWNGL